MANSLYDEKKAAIEAKLKAANEGYARGGRWKYRKRFRAQAAAAQKELDQLMQDKQMTDSADESTVSGRIAKATGGVWDDRMRQVYKGAQFAESVIGPEGLGRLGEDEEVLAIQQQYKELAKGYDSKQMQAMREKAGEQITGSTEAQARALQAQMAQSGVKGMQGAFQQSQLRQGAIKAKADLERDLMIQQRGAVMEGLDKYADVTGQIKTFDISQAAKEKDIALQAGLGFAGMQSVEKQAELSAAAQRAAARAAKAPSCFLEGTLIIMADDTTKKIEDIKIGDRLKFGGVVYSLHVSMTERIYKYKDVYVTGSHAVLEDEWIRVENSPYGELEEGVFTVYNLGTEFHRIVCDSSLPQGILFSDADETDFGTRLNDKESLEALNGKRAKLLSFRNGV